MFSVLRAAPSLAKIPHKGFLSITGSQTAEFLNGVLATAIRQPLKPGLSTVLNAQGRVLHDVFLYTHTDEKGKPGYILEYDARASDAAPLLDVLKRYVLRAKVKIRDASDQYESWAAWGSSQAHLEHPRTWQWAQSGCVEPVWDSQTCPWGLEEGVIHDRRAVGMGKRMLIRKGDKPSEILDHNFLADGYTRHRILNGVPEGTFDIPPTYALPIESNLDMMGGLDFRKGCYVGQELTVRTYHKGVIRKRIYPITFEKASEATSCPRVTPGCSIKAEGQRRPVGRLLTTDAGHALALLKSELVEANTKFMVMDQGDVAWNITPTVPEWWPTPPPVHNDTEQE